MPDRCPTTAGPGPADPQPPSDAGPAPLIAAGFDRALRVHDLAQLAAVLAAAGGRPVLVVSGRGAGAYAGAGWWRALLAAPGAGEAVAVAHGREGRTGPAPTAVLDCDGAPGAVMAAVRAGIRDILYRPAAGTADGEAACDPAAAALVGLAAAAGCRLWRPPLPPVLDLDTVPDAEAAARRWLAGPPPAGDGRG